VRRLSNPPMSRHAEVEPRVLERARAGDQGAFTALIRHYDRGLRALAYRLLGDRDRMDDALQEAYLRAFRALPSFRGSSGVGTWLYRIAYNACVDELERSRRTAVVSLEDAPERSDGRPDLADRIVGRTELAEALAELAPDDRAAVMLVDAQGFDYAGAGEVLGVPAGTIASRLNRARTALRRTLARRMEGVPKR
jgi:RNA polymerase sigma-70 factor (ECF subfamily)